MTIVEKNRHSVNKVDYSELQKNVNFIDKQFEFHQKNAERYANDSNPFRSVKHQETAANFRDLKNFILQQDKDAKENIKAPSGRVFLSLTKEDIEDLPKEQLAELSISSSDHAEFSILAMLEDFGGIMSLDQIIVCLYKETGDVQKRATVTARLYRMVQKGTIYSVPLKKGVYSLTEISTEKAEAMFKGGVVETDS